MMLNRLVRCIRHRWLDTADVRRHFSREEIIHLERQIETGEQGHRGEVRVCVEAGLPSRALWQHFWHSRSIGTLTRNRAWALFAKLGVWDTRDNNGVLIYLCLAERAIEIVADRGLAGKVDAKHWQTIVLNLAQPLAEGQFEQGLKSALAEVNALLIAHFPLHKGQTDQNELSNALVIL